MYKSMNRQAHQMPAMSLIKRQAGATLMETMISLALSAWCFGHGGFDGQFTWHGDAGHPHVAADR